MWFFSKAAPHAADGDAVRGNGRPEREHIAENYSEGTVDGGRPQDTEWFTEMIRPMEKASESAAEEAAERAAELSQEKEQSSMQTASPVQARLLQGGRGSPFASLRSGPVRSMGAAASVRSGISGSAGTSRDSSGTSGGAGTSGSAWTSGGAQFETVVGNAASVPASNLQTIRARNDAATAPTLRAGTDKGDRGNTLYYGSVFGHAGAASDVGAAGSSRAGASVARMPFMRNMGGLTYAGAGAKAESSGRGAGSTGNIRPIKAMAAGSGADTSGSGMGIPAIKGMSSGNTSGTGIPTIRGMGSMGSGITTTGTGSMVVCERCGKVIDVNAKDRKFVASLK